MSEFRSPLQRHLPNSKFSRELKDGDIVNVDVTVYLDGFHGDTSRTFLIGNVASSMELSHTRTRKHLISFFSSEGRSRPKARLNHRICPPSWRRGMSTRGALQNHWCSHPRRRRPARILRLSTILWARHRCRLSPVSMDFAPS